MVHVDGIYGYPTPTKWYEILVAMFTQTDVAKPGYVKSGHFYLELK